MTSDPAVSCESVASPGVTVRDITLCHESPRLIRDIRLIASDHDNNRTDPGVLHVHGPN
jgi:hypothetical protein